VVVAEVGEKARVRVVCSVRRGGPSRASPSGNASPVVERHGTLIESLRGHSSRTPDACRFYRQHCGLNSAARCHPASPVPGSVRRAPATVRARRNAVWRTPAASR